MKIEVSNRQRLRRPNVPGLRSLVRRALSRASRPGPPPEWSCVSLVLTDDDGIRGINREHLGKDAATDVIAFRLEPIPGEGPGLTGEVFVNVQRALAAAPKRRGWSASRELALYVAHGCDHLRGACDRTPAERARMRRRELRWLREAGREGGLEDLLSGPVPRKGGPSSRAGGPG